MFSVFPASLPTSSSTQLINIYGANFKPVADPHVSTLVFRDPANNPSVRTPIYVSANQLQYNITVAGAVGTWSVIVTNAGQVASNPQTFTVYTPPPNTGSLTVNLTPSDAVSAGAQWRVDGGTYRNNGDTAIGLAPGSHPVSFKAVTGYTTPADKNASIIAGANTPETGNYIAVAPTLFHLSLNSDHGQLWRNPNRDTFSPGETVRIGNSVDTGWHFDHWSGDASGTANPIDVVMNSDKTVTANYASGDWSIGAILVTIQPSEAAAAGARWRVDGGVWQNSGVTLNNAGLGDNYLEFSAVAGWTRPLGQFIVVVGGQTTNIVGTYTQDLTAGTLTVLLTPPEVTTAGAQWCVNGGAPLNSGASVSLPPESGNTVTFNAVPGWMAPPNQTVAVGAGQTTIVTASYTPQSGRPYISAISPNMGPLGGGTSLTIDGANFSSPVTVLVAGNPAMNAVALSSTEVTCLTPSNSFYGTVPIVLQTSGGSITNLNGFTYGNARGAGIELAGQLGGAVNCAAVAGNYAFVGQGTRLQVVNIATPASPSPVGTALVLGDTVNDISVSGNYAYIANNEDGLRIVDISNPLAPALRGFWDTPVRAKAVALLGGRAYVADGTGGLQIINIADPTAPRLVGSLNWGEEAVAIAVAAKTNGVFAYISLGSGGLRIVDVTTPSSPVLRGLYPIADPMGSKYSSVSISGNKAYVAQDYYGLAIIDINNADAPGLISRYTTWANGLELNGSYAYLASTLGFQIINISNPSSPVRAGIDQTKQFNRGSRITHAGQYAFVSGGTTGFLVYNVANPSTPNIVGQCQQYVNYAHGITLTSDSAYISTDIGLEVADISSPAVPQIRATLPLGQTARTFVDSGRAYCVAGAELKIVTNVIQGQLKLAGTIPYAAFLSNDIFLDGYAYLVGQDVNSHFPQLRVYNLANPANPIVLGTTNSSSASGGVAIRILKRGTLAYVLEQSGGLRIVDVTQSSHPVQKGYLAATVESFDMVFSSDGQRLFVGTETGFKVIDVTNPDAPSLLVTHNLDSTVLGLEVVQNLIFIAATSCSALLVYDVTDPVHPVLLRSYATPAGTGIIDVGVQGDYVYAACGTSGMLVLKLLDLENPEIFITNPTFSPEYTTSTGTVDLGGSAQDNKGVTRMTWANNRGGGGELAVSESWFLNGIILQPGTNILTVAAFDQAGNSGKDTLTVNYEAPKQDQTITFPALADKTFGDLPVALAAAASSGLPVSFSLVSGPASLSSNVLTLTAAGIVTVRATQPGNDLFNPATNVDRSFNIERADQALTFVQPPDKSADDPPFTLIANASSGLPVSFEILIGPAVLETNIVTLLGGGVVMVSASQPGNSNYNSAASVQRSFNVSKLVQSITFGSLQRQTLGDAPFPIIATASSGLPVNFAIISGLAGIDGNIVTVINKGLVVVRASQAGNLIYAPATNVDQTLVVAPGNNLITDAGQLPGGNFTFTFCGEFGRPYVVELSTNLILTNWVPLVTNFVDSFGNLQFTDSAATNRAQGFYRVKGQ